MIEGGFFTKKETQSSARADGKIYSCSACGLYLTCKSPKMQVSGNFKKGILNIGEAPGEVEDRVGKPWQGKTGQLLVRTYEKFGIDLFEDCLNINAVSCRPVDEEGNNRAPSDAEIDCCRRFVMKIITERKPKLVILLGSSAVYSAIGNRWKKDFDGIFKWRGFTIPDQDLKTWLCPVFHPSFVERASEDGVHAVWTTDLREAFEKLTVPFPIAKEPNIQYIHNPEILLKIPNGSVCAIDYETTGLKPHAIGHRIICMAVAYTQDDCYAFHLPNKRRELEPIRTFLANPEIKKMAHNMKFEEAWSVEQLRQPVQGWFWDSMLAAHVVDNRSKITGLKFQTYVQFGIIDYSSDIEPYLASEDPNNANALNQIYKLLEKPGGSEKLLYYCGCDAVYEYRLAKVQQSEIILPF